MRVNGLYGHVRSNDARSLALFAGFVVAFQVLAMLSLVVPLAILDPEHSPLYGWTGYLVRWVPVVTVVGAILFIVQMAWHVRIVRRRTDFRFVDDHDEPRLCRIVEPLTIAAGLPTPYVAVIDSPALNAFACGIRQKDAVLVFTRGLVDGLDDDELAAVAAHEIIHIVNGDIRLIAATNVCLDTLNLLQPRPMGRLKRIQQALALPFLAWVFPLLLVLILGVMLLRRLALVGSHLTRLLIASAREFIADAESVRLTQNPAALVSALRRIEGRSVIPGLVAGQDAMMIDGAHEGALATHPTIADRIAAIVAVTGSMTIIAPARRDTRSFGPAAGSPFGRRAASGPDYLRSAVQGAGVALAPEPSGWFARLGLTPELTLGIIASLGVFVWFYGPEFARPSRLAMAFDPAPLRDFFAASRDGIHCQTRGIGWTFGLAAKPTDCDKAYEKQLAAHRGKNDALGKLADAMPPVGMDEATGIYTHPNGTFTSVAPLDYQLREVQRNRCFQSRYSVERNLHSVNEQPHRDISMSRYLTYNDKAARNVMDSAPASRDQRIVEYYDVRKLMSETIHRFFGDPGLQMAAARATGPDHEGAIAALRQRLSDPAFAAKLGPLKSAEAEILVAAPQDFVSCLARRLQAPKQAQKKP
jgi:Zn-dependent protease with chaperone function